MPKFIKKKEMISDSGVELTANIIDFLVTTICIVISAGLLVLAFVTYTSI